MPDKCYIHYHYCDNVTSDKRKRVLRLSLQPLEVRITHRTNRCPGKGASDIILVHNVTAVLFPYKRIICSLINKIV
jgi:hypothetical protein